MASGLPERRLRYPAYAVLKHPSVIFGSGPGEVISRRDWQERCIHDLLATLFGDWRPSKARVFAMRICSESCRPSLITTRNLEAADMKDLLSRRPDADTNCTRSRQASGQSRNRPIRSIRDLMPVCDEWRSNSMRGSVATRLHVRRRPGSVFRPKRRSRT